MRMRLLFFLIICGTASATESVLGPPDSQPQRVIVEPETPIPPDVLECIVAAIEAGLDPAEECDL